MSPIVHEAEHLLAILIQKNSIQLPIPLELDDQDLQMPLLSDEDDDNFIADMETLPELGMCDTPVFTLVEFPQETKRQTSVRVLKIVF